MGKLAKCIDLVAAIFLMFLFPAVFIHVKMRDRLFEACVARVQEYGEMMQKQGYMSMDAAGHLLGENKSLEAGIFSAVRITLIQEQGGEDQYPSFPYMEILIKASSPKKISPPAHSICSSHWPHGGNSSLYPVPDLGSCGKYYKKLQKAIYGNIDKSIFPEKNLPSRT